MSLLVVRQSIAQVTQRESARERRRGFKEIRKSFCGNLFVNSSLTRSSISGLYLNYVAFSLYTFQESCRVSSSIFSKIDDGKKTM